MWEISNLEQAASYALAFALGIVFCLIYDILRALRRVTHQSDFTVFVTDLVYFAVFAIVTFCLMLVTTLGQTRGFIYFGIALGFLVCRISLSVLFFKIAVFLLTKIFAALRWIRLKFYALLGVIFKILAVVFKKNAEICKNMCFSIKKLLHKKADVVYNQD